MKRYLVGEIICIVLLVMGVIGGLPTMFSEGHNLPFYIGFLIPIVLLVLGICYFNKKYKATK